MSGVIHFFDNTDDGLRPTEEARIVEVCAEVSPDRRRVLVTVQLTPSMHRPDFDVTLLRDGEEIRSTSVVGAFQPENQLTLHLPAGAAGGSYVARVDLLRDEQVVQTASAAFDVA